MTIATLSQTVWKDWTPPTTPIWTPEYALSQGSIGIYVVIDGNNSAGKSKYVEHLQESEQIRKLQLYLHSEKGEQLIFLEEPIKARVSEIEEWYKSLGNFADKMKKSDIGFEFAALMWRIQQQEEKLKGFKGIAIGERPPFAGKGYYIPALYKQGKITEEHYHWYMAVVGEIAPYFAWPQLWQTFHTDSGVCRKRVLSDDNRKDQEKEFLTEDYLSSLEDEILKNATVGAKNYCKTHGIPRPTMLLFDTTEDIALDKTLRVRAATDLFERITTLVQQQRAEIERRRNEPKAEVKQ